MHKFYSEPVAALDLRLTKSEATLFGMESNPLDVDVKMDEQLETKEEEEIPIIPLDYSEVQVSQSPPLPLTPTEVAHYGDPEPHMVIKDPLDIQHVTLHIARSPPQYEVTAPTTGWPQTQVDRVSSSSSSSYPTSSTSPPHHTSTAPHRHPVIEEWRGLGVAPSNLWLFPRTPNHRRDDTCPREKEWSRPANPLMAAPPFEQECIKSPTPQESGFPACYGPDLSSHSPPLLPKFTSLPASHFTPHVFQPHPTLKSSRHAPPVCPDYRQQPTLSRPPSPTSHPQRQFGRPDHHAPRGSVIVHHPPVLKQEMERSSNFPPECAKGILRHPPSLESLMQFGELGGLPGPAHAVKQEDLSQTPLYSGEEFKHGLEEVKNPQWLNKIQQLRTDFAFQMLEAQRKQHDHDHDKQLCYPPTLQLLSQLSGPRDPYLQQQEQSKATSGSRGSLDLMNTFLQRMDPPRRSHQESLPSSTSSSGLPTTPGPLNRLGKRGRPRKHAPKVPLPPLYVFIRNLLYSPAYNPSIVAWVDQAAGCFKVQISFGINHLSSLDRII